MIFRSIYSKKFTMAIRIIAVTAAVILIVSNIFSIIGIDSGTYSLRSAENIFIFCVNCTSIVLCILLTVFPEKLELITLMAFFNSALCFLDYCNPMAVIMYALGITTLLARGFFRAHIKIKTAAVISVYFLLWLLQLRFSLERFLICVLHDIAYTFTLTVSFFFFMYFVHITDEQKSETTLNLADYPTLDARDSKILNMIKARVKYDAIAPQVFLSVGALKNRLKFIYTTLSVGDRHGFLNKYEGFEIVYKKDEPESPQE